MLNRPRLYFSFRSPFSWLAVKRLQRDLPNVFDTVEFVPYWEPDAETERLLSARGASFHYVQMSRAKHLYILQDVKRLARRLQLQLAWPIDVDPCWEVPHLGWLEANRLGTGAAFYEAIVKTRWEDGENVCEEQVIRRLAEAIGIRSDDVVAATANPRVRAQGVDCLARAYEDDVFGVPYFRVRWERFWGFDRVDDFLAAVQRSQPVVDGVCHAADGEFDHERRGALPRIPQALKRHVGAYDSDSPGGCG